jgi:hypothetical protein
VLVELSPSVYLALCALVQDALQQPSDATPLLQRVAKELADGAEEVATEIANQPERAEALRRVAVG